MNELNSDKPFFKLNIIVFYFYVHIMKKYSDRSTWMSINKVLFLYFR